MEMENFIFNVSLILTFFNRQIKINRMERILTKFLGKLKI